MLIATLKNTKASNVNLNQYLTENAIGIDSANRFDPTGKEGWFLGTEAEFQLKKKIESVGKPLKDWDVKINYGIKTGLNEAFIISREKRDELIAKDPKSAEIIKPILRGRDIKRYGYEFAELYLLFIPWHFPLHKNPNITGASLEAEKEFEKQYPAIYYHLLEYKENFSKRNKSETGIRYEWYALQRCANTYYKEFEKEKLVWNRIASKKEFGLVDQDVFISDSMHFITGENLKYVSALLNSKLIQFILSIIVGDAVGGNSGNAENVANLPIPILNTPEKQAIARRIEVLVEQILAVKTPVNFVDNPFTRGNKEKDKTNLPLSKGSDSHSLGVSQKPQSPLETAPLQGATDTTDLENQIDTLVFELYGLSEVEIAVVLG